MLSLSLSLSLKKQVKTLTFLSQPGPVCLWKCEQIGSTTFYILNGWRKWEAQQAIENYILSCRCGGFFFFTPLKRRCFCICFFWLWLALGNFCLAYILFYFLWADFFFFFWWVQYIEVRRYWATTNYQLPVTCPLFSCLRICNFFFQLKTYDVIFTQNCCLWSRQIHIVSTYEYLTI